MRLHPLRPNLILLSCVMVVALAGCSAEPAGGTQTQAAVQAAPEVPTAQSAPTVEPDPTPTSQAFDVNTLPISDAALGEFPYFTLPAGYTSKGPGRTEKSATKDFARFPFWVDQKDQWIEGKFYYAAFAAEQGKDFSEFEISKNFDSAIRQLGGTKVGEGNIPVDVVKNWGPEINGGFRLGIDPARYKYPASTSSVWVIRRNDGNIWVFLTTNPKRGGYVVGKETAYTQTSELISASTLKQAIDATGKVAIQVNFATDKTDILPDSQSQIDQVVQLLKDDAALKLAINGHTDNTGSTSHNQALSEGRAQSVIAALVAKGIAPTMLTAEGFGDTQPVADNGSEEGKAKNRRVELVKVSN